MRQIFPEVLIVSNKFDFSTDLVTYSLNKLGVSYFRINRDQFKEYGVKLDPVKPELSIFVNDTEYIFVEPILKSVFFRAPTFLRDIFQEEVEAEEQLYRTQWAAFIRALSVFNGVNWVNNPVDTYRAEIKALQLKCASEAGLLIPESIITNMTVPRPGETLAIKSIDTAIVSSKGEEAFVYTTITNGADLEDRNFSSPFFIQKALTPKTDVRITFIGDEVLAVYIKGKGGIDGDWRRFENDLEYEIFELPEEIRDKCLKFNQVFNLKYSAIDMVIYKSDFYFIEVNPTGEWAWLQKNTGVDIGMNIAKYLANEDPRK